MRVVLVDDAALFRQAVGRLLTTSGVEVDGEAAEPEEAIRLALDRKPDVVVLDVRMPPTYTTEGLEVAQRIRAAAPEIGLLILSAVIEPHAAIRLLTDVRGRVGYLLKDRVIDADDLLDALRRVAHGGTVIDPTVVTAMLGPSRVPRSLLPLSERERAVLALMAEGRSNVAIGEALHLGQKTVETHIRAIFQRLGLVASPDEHRRVMAVLRYLEHG